MTTRRAIIKSICALAGAKYVTLPVVAKSNPSQVILPPLATSAPICLDSFRLARNAVTQFKKNINDLKSQLPKDKKFFLCWTNIVNKETNPHGRIGFFVAVPASADQKEHIALDEYGFFANLRKGLRK